MKNLYPYGEYEKNLYQQIKKSSLLNPLLSMACIGFFLSGCAPIALKNRPSVPQPVEDARFDGMGKMFDVNLLDLEKTSSARPSFSTPHQPQVHNPRRDALRSPHLEALKFTDILGRVMSLCERCFPGAICGIRENKAAGAMQIQLRVSGPRAQDAFLPLLSSGEVFLISISIFQDRKNSTLRNRPLRVSMRHIDKRSRALKNDPSMHGNQVAAELCFENALLSALIETCIH